MKIKKSLGQNFLNNNDILNRIVECGDIQEKDIIIEIGPGTGNLTQKLLDKKPRKLIVVEKDTELSNFLKSKFNKKLEVINEDILKYLGNFKFDNPVKVFGNLPYNISTKILLSFLKLNNLEKLYKKFIFIFQKEVAERIISDENSKNYGRLSILTSWKTEKKKIIDIAPKYFYPKPRVWSTLLTLVPKTKIEKLKKPKHLEHITNVFFSQRRKMIKKPMKILFRDYERIAEELEIDLTLRPQNLSKKKYLEICKIYDKLN